MDRKTATTLAVGTLAYRAGRRIAQSRSSSGPDDGAAAAVEDAVARVSARGHRSSRRKARSRAPAAIGGARRTGGTSTTTLTRREHVGSYLSTTSFNVDAMEINPGDALSFPWLSSAARGFERYRFTKLVLRAQPRMPTDTRGAVVLAYNPDVTAPDPATADELLDLTSVESSMWEDATISVPKKVLQGWRLVRERVMPGDPSQYQPVKLFIATFGAEAATDGLEAGSVWLDYTVELSGTRIPQVAYQPLHVTTALAQGISTMTTGTTYDVPLHKSTADFDPHGWLDETNNRFLVPPGVYRLDSQFVPIHNGTSLTVRIELWKDADYEAWDDEVFAPKHYLDCVTLFANDKADGSLLQVKFKIKLTGDGTLFTNNGRIILTPV